MKHLSTVSESCPKLAQWMVIIEALDRARCQRGPGRNDNVGLITTASAAPRMLLFFFLESRQSRTVMTLATFPTSQANLFYDDSQRLAV